MSGVLILLRPMWTPLMIMSIVCVLGNGIISSDCPGIVRVDEGSPSEVCFTLTRSNMVTNVTVRKDNKSVMSSYNESTNRVSVSILNATLSDAGCYVLHGDSEPQNLTLYVYASPTKPIIVDQGDEKTGFRLVCQYNLTSLPAYLRGPSTVTWLKGNGFIDVNAPVIQPHEIEQGVEWIECFVSENGSNLRSETSEAYIIPSASSGSGWSPGHIAAVVLIPMAIFTFAIAFIIYVHRDRQWHRCCDSQFKSPMRRRGARRAVSQCQPSARFSMHCKVPQAVGPSLTIPNLTQDTPTDTELPTSDEPSSPQTATWWRATMTLPTRSTFAPGPRLEPGKAPPPAGIQARGKRSLFARRQRREIKTMDFSNVG